MAPKFRCWDERLGLTEVVSIDFFRKKIKINHWEYGDSNFFPLDEVVLMQSTGLKDKNGVEIFEGDIVSVRNHPFQKTEKSGAGIEIDGDYAISWNEGDLTWCAGNLLLARLKPYVTVAGNIYEKPELLEQANES